jgi:DNA-binding CsgD family transcriptional regulator
MAGDIAAGMAHYEQAVALFRTLGDLQGLSSCLATLALRGASYTFSATVWPIVEAAACTGDGEEALRVARQIGWRAGEANASTYLAMAHGPRGEYALALERAQAALEIAQEIGHAVWIVGARIALGAIALDLLAFEVARDHLEQALEMAHELGGFLVRYVASLLTSACVAQRDLARAEAVLAATFAPDTPMEMQGQRSIWCARAELALASGDPAEALRIADRLIASAAHAERYGAGCAPRLWHLRGTALAELGRDADAEASLLAAGQGAAERGLRPMCWRLQASLGRCYQRLGRRKQAEESFAAARALVDQLAITIVDDTMREAFRRGADKLLPRLPDPTPRRAAKGAFGGLTEREREIAALIAQGRSNREIAEALVLSERTVATHVSNALAKLNFTTRAQVAAWASINGLVNPQ